MSYTDQETAWLAYEVRQTSPRTALLLNQMGIAHTAQAWELVLFNYRTDGAYQADSTILHEVSNGLAALRELLASPTEACWKCGGEQEVVDYDVAPGFAGGRCYFTLLACGHVNADESDDVRAAR